MAKSLPSGVAGALRSWLGGARRFLMFRGYASAEVPSSRGVPQGNVLSVSLAILWASVWHALMVSAPSSTARESRPAPHAAPNCLAKFPKGFLHVTLKAQTPADRSDHNLDHHHSFMKRTWVGFGAFDSLKPEGP